MQVLQPCLLSLFVPSSEVQEVHGAVNWLIKAYLDYRDRVINNKISYKAFMEENHVKLSMPIFLEEGATYDDFLQEAIDRDKVKHILENRKFTEDCFATETFDETEATQMITKYNEIGIRENITYSARFLSLSDYPMEVKQNLAAVFRKHNLLCPEINSEDLVLLLTTGKPSCKYMIPSSTRNVDLGLALNILSSIGAFCRNWSSAICSPGMLLTASGKKMQGKNLSAAVHKFDNYSMSHLDDKQKKIERDVKKVLEGVPGVVKMLK